ncbi:MAG: aspartate--tRNA(Asn) ligase [Patescibacteria group bacterium]|nr:aspartate--tRNA(Asn) ligase [Patescibacteria group bacterium]
MERTVALETIGKIGQEVRLAGWVNRRRDHGKIVFLDLRDRSGIVQLIVQPRGLDKETLAAVEEIRPEYVIEVEGQVLRRDEKTVNANLPTGSVEVQVKKISVLSKAEGLPFDMGGDNLDLSLPVLLDWRTLTLRHKKIADIFRIQSAVLSGFRKAAESLGCVEISVPTIATSATEGGAEVFRVKYYDYWGYLTQSPQLYKQMLIPSLERVYTVAKAYRAEPSVTTRHLSEATQMDCEFGFVSFSELLDLLENVAVVMLSHVEETQSEILRAFGQTKLEWKKIPRLKLRQAQEIIFNETGRDVRAEKDLSPQDEADISAWAKREHKSDLVTITHFPTRKRAFYTLPDPEDPEYSLSYDLIFKGMEVLSGSQRIHNYESLVSAIKERGLDFQAFEMYLQAFKYGMPPEGGFSFGLERITKQLLNLSNVREASLFPRDMERVDFRLSKP